MNQIELGHRIRQCRKMKHLTQEKLAELISVSPHYIYEVEKGLKSMSLATFIDLCTVLNVSTDYLLFGTTALPTQVDDKSPSLDELSVLLENLSPQKRDDLANILATLLPYLK